MNLTESGLVIQAVAKAGQLKAANAEFIVADVEEHSFPEASFDAILSSSAIPYLQHIPRTFQRFRTWLKEGGSFVFSTPEVRMRIAHMNALLPASASATKTTV